MDDSTLFIINPISGSGNKSRMLKAIRKHYKSPYRIVFTERAGHAIELARDAEESFVVAVGGDGTVSEVARGLAEYANSTNSGKILGILPCGSGDGLALHLGMSRRPAKAVKMLSNASPVLMDYATISESGDSESDKSRMFFCTAGIGLDADVADAFSKSGHRGLWSYIVNAWHLWWDFKPMDCKVTVDGETFSGKASIVTVGNASQWGNNASICPKASLTDGLLDVSFVRPFPIGRVPVLAFRLLTGRLYGTKELTVLRGREITIDRGRKGVAHYDGDPCQMGERLDFKVHPAAIKVAVPPKNKRI